MHRDDITNHLPIWGFEELGYLSTKKLFEYGFASWDENLVLIPGKFYDCIPNGYKVFDINGKYEYFEHGKTDNDQRFGLLAYGFKRSAK